jgi:hypothetical protein
MSKTITEHEAEQVEIDGASHGLTLDHTWRKSCDTALKFVQRFV